MHILLLSLFIQATAIAGARNRPNILWINLRDVGADDLGCYGNTYAHTPNTDNLSKQSCRFDNAFSPSYAYAGNANSAVLTGVHPATLGTLYPPGPRKVTPPVAAKFFSEYLRSEGYYCCNPSQMDFDFIVPLTAWDSRTGDWKNEERGNRPFFVLLSIDCTSEPHLCKLDNIRHSLDKVAIPPYYPDTPIIRKALAKHYDNVEEMDRRVGEILARLKKDNLENSTLVCLWSSNGKALPRNKFWTSDEGNHVPLVIRWPGKIQAGSVNDELVDLIDLAPTMLSLARVAVPPLMQGRVVMGPGKGQEPTYLYAVNGPYERTIRTRRHRYVYRAGRCVWDFPGDKRRNPVYLELQRLDKESKLTKAQRLVLTRAQKPIHQLYDVIDDPCNMINLVADYTFFETYEYGISPLYESAISRKLRRIRNYFFEAAVKTVDQSGANHIYALMSSKPETEEPTIEVRPGANGQMLIVMSCKTPGASIGYQFGNGSWRLYSKPISYGKTRRNTTLTARAVRLGFKASPDARRELSPN